MEFDHAVERVAGRLEAAGLSFGQGFMDAHDEALRIVYAAMGIDLGHELGTVPDRSGQRLEQSEIARMEALALERVETRRPLAYLLNEAWFCGRRFFVDERVIIPRSYFSEWIPERFEPWVAPDDVDSILDLCCGCGCIAVCCAQAFPDARIVASDVSAGALEVARRNIAHHGLEERITLRRSDCFSGIDERFSLIICNPPYVAGPCMETLPEEYRHEPGLALSGGMDGLDVIASVLCDAGDFLKPHGIIMMESGSSSRSLERLCAQVPFMWLSTCRDERVVCALDVEAVRAAKRAFVRAGRGSGQVSGA